MTTVPSVAIIVPVLGRPANVKPLMASITDVTPESHRLLFVASEGDKPEQEALDAAAADWITCDEPGTWARKQNVGFRATDEPFVFLAADDLRFHDGWLTEALRVMGNVTIPELNEIAVVGTNDLCNERTWSPDPRWVHSTHTLVRRSYIDGQGGTLDKGPGVVLAEEYPHEYADDELVETAKHRGVYAHAYDSHVEHLNPLCGKAELDDTYALGRSRTRDSRRIYNERAERLGFAPPRWQSSRHAGLLARRARGEGDG